MLQDVFSRQSENAKEDPSHADKLDYPTDRNHEASIAALARAQIALAKDADAADKRQSSYNKRSHRISFWTAVGIGAYTILTTMIVIFTVAQYGEIHRFNKRQLRLFNDQLGVMQAQTNAMRGQLRMLEQQVIDAREMQRAFITASDYKITKIDGDAADQSCWRFRPIISNAGGSPTVELRYVIQVVFVALRRPGEQGSAWGLILAPTDPDTVFQRSGGWDGALLGPKQNLPDTPANDRVCLTKDDSSYIFAPQRVYARGAIHYHDRYPGTPEHITKYCFWIRAIEDGSGWRPEPALCSHWNCADAECKRDEDAYADEVAETFKKAGQTPEPPAEFFPQ